MPEDYGSHHDYFEWVREEADERTRSIEEALHKAFAGFIETREVDVIVFSSMSAADLASAIMGYPAILKALLTICNIAARAIERDLGIKNLDTYRPRLSEDQSKIIAGYIKPFLPDYLEIPTLAQVDRISFIDKEIRKRKGRWEKKILDCLNRCSAVAFTKRKFRWQGEIFELDAAYPKSGPVAFGIDIKRIEARRDIHKRCDEIVNKASRLKAAFPESKFGVIIYYPFVDEHSNVQNRLRSTDIDGVAFASEGKESINSAVRLLLSGLGVEQK